MHSMFQLYPGIRHHYSKENISKERSIKCQRKSGIESKHKLVCTTTFRRFQQERHNAADKPSLTCSDYLRLSFVLPFLSNQTRANMFTFGVFFHVEAARLCYSYVLHPQHKVVESYQTLNHFKFRFYIHFLLKFRLSRVHIDKLFKLL